MRAPDLPADRIHKGAGRKISQNQPSLVSSHRVALLPVAEQWFADGLSIAQVWLTN
jgi:hypothetical protein